MKKQKTKSLPILLMLVSVLLFIVISFYSAGTLYYEHISNTLADPQGTSTQLEDVLNVLIVIASFTPSGLLIAYPYVKNNFVKYIYLRSFLLAIVLGIVYWILYSIYNFQINFGR